MFRTALPFGYLLIFLGLAAAFVIGLVLFVTGRLRRSKPVAFLGGALALVVAIAVVSDVYFDAAMEWNPEIASDTEVVGRWQDRDETVTLAPDHTFTYETKDQIVHGTWSRYDWNLRMAGNNGPLEMRFVQYNGKTHLMTRPPEDPDVWDGDLGLKLANR